MSQSQSGPISSEGTTKDLHHSLPSDNQQLSTKQNNQNVPEKSIKDDKPMIEEKLPGEEEIITALSSHTKNDMEDALLLQELFISGTGRADSTEEKKKISEETVKLPKKKRKIELNQPKDADDEKEAYDSRQFKKIDENIYLGDSTVYAWKNLFDDDIIMCTCSPSKKGDISGDDHCGEYCVNRLLCMECVMGYCRCGSNCTNNSFQKKSWKRVQVKRAGEKGFGVFAREKITKGSFIIEYVGEVLDEKIYKERQEAYDGERHYYFLSVGTNQIIDASKKGNNARFINHSCDPNSVLQKWTVGHQSRIGVFSLRDIEKGEEITFDYAMECYGVSFQKCYCGSKNCRGTITSKEVTLLEAKEKLTQMDSEQVKKLRAHKLDSKFKQRTLYTLKILEDSSKLPKEVIDTAKYGNAFLIRNIRRTEKKRFRQFLSIERQLNETKQKEDEPEKDEFGLTEYERVQMARMYEKIQKGENVEGRIRSRRCKTVTNSTSSMAESSASAQPRVTRTTKKKAETTTEEPKKKRGRPPKRAVEESESDESESEDEEFGLSYDEESEDEKTKSTRKVGRPKKNLEEEPKRRVGRPRKTESSDTKEKSKARTEVSKTETKRKVGRPKKEESEKKPQTKKRKVEESSSSSSESDDSDRSSRTEAKRKVGRPRKTETTITTPKVEEEKRKVGRPKKVIEEKKVVKETKSTTSIKSEPKPILTTPKQSDIKPKKSSTEVEAPKRKVGRPRKDEQSTEPKTKDPVVKKELPKPPKPSTSSTSSTSSSTKADSSDSKPRRIVHNTKVKDESSSESEEEAPKRKVGRPRKDEQQKMKKDTKEEETPKRKVGRPRKDEQQIEPKRKVGRPRKVIVSSSSESESSESESEDDNPKNDYEVFNKFNVRISKLKAYEGLSSLPNKRKYNSQKPRT